MFLRLASYGFRGVVRRRNWLYEHGFLEPRRSRVPVVSVGNIVAGGTGKTPTTLMLAERLLKDFSVAILSRGYRSKAEKRREPLLVSKGHGPMCGPQACGDEVYMLSSRLPEAIIVAGRNRYRAANIAVEAGAQVVLLDDGMQHRKLARDVEIVVVNGLDPYGGGYFLPRGHLRDEPKRLLGADLIVVNGGREIGGSLPQVVVENQPQKILSSDGKEVQLAPGSCVGIFCGVGNPAGFINTVEKMGHEVVATHFMRDHRMIGRKELRRLSLRAKKNGAELLLCTEKDAVKGLSSEGLALPIGWVKSGMVIQKNQEGWEGLISKISKLIGENR